MQLRNKRKIGSIKQAELEEVLLPYEGWSDWIMNKACPFSDREIFIINSYRRHHSHNPAAEELGISTSRVSFFYIRMLGRLRSEQCKKRYYEWHLDMLLIELGINKYKDKTDEFLNMPIWNHRLPIPLYCRLSMCGETIKEILEKHTEKTMLQYTGFGKKTLEQFKTMLIENECINLLKK